MGALLEGGFAGARTFTAVPVLSPIFLRSAVGTARILHRFESWTIRTNIVCTCASIPRSSLGWHRSVAILLRTGGWRSALANYIGHHLHRYRKPLRAPELGVGGAANKADAIAAVPEEFKDRVAALLDTQNQYSVSRMLAYFTDGNRDVLQAPAAANSSEVCVGTMWTTSGGHRGTEGACVVGVNAEFGLVQLMRLRKTQCAAHGCCWRFADRRSRVWRDAKKELVDRLALVPRFACKADLVGSLPRVCYK